MQLDTLPAKLANDLRAYFDALMEYETLKQDLRRAEIRKSDVETKIATVTREVLSCVGDNIPVKHFILRQRLVTVDHRTCSITISKIEGGE